MYLIYVEFCGTNWGHNNRNYVVQGNQTEVVKKLTKYIKKDFGSADFRILSMSYIENCEYVG
jgi:hypothetical protein